MSNGHAAFKLGQLLSFSDLYMAVSDWKKDVRRNYRSPPITYISPFSKIVEIQTKALYQLGCSNTAVLHLSVSSFSSPRFEVSIATSLSHNP